MRNQKILRSVLLLLIPMLLLFCTACGSKTAVSSSYESVGDPAGILSAAAELEIRDVNRKLYAACGSQIRILTVPTAGGAPISEYAEQAFSEWDCGDGCVLLVIASEDRDYWAVAGKDTGLSSGALQRILEGNFEPKFAAGDPEGAALDTVSDLVAYFTTYHHVTLPDEVPSGSSGYPGSGSSHQSLGLFGWVWEVILWVADIAVGLVGWIFGAIGDIFGVVRALPSFLVIAIVIVVVIALGRKSGK